MNEALNKERWRQIGFLLQHERKCQHLEQEVVVRKMDVRQESISRIEAGKRRIDILELIEYAEAIGFSISEIAWKIETYLSGLWLLPLPKTNVLGKKIRINVSWRENKFSASFGEIFPETWVFTADKFEELQIGIEEDLDSRLRALESGGIEVPKWLKNKEYEFEYKFMDARSLLNAYCPHYVSLAVISRVSGINQNLLSQYVNGIKKARPKQLKRIMDAIHQIGRELVAAVI